MIEVFFKYSESVFVKHATEAKFVPPTEIGATLILRVTSNRYEVCAEFLASEVLGWIELEDEEESNE